MARIGNLITSIKVGKKRFKNPEWWNTAHKLKKEIKYTEYCKANSNLNSSYMVNSGMGEKSADKIISEYRDDLSSGKYSVFAPWNSMFRPYKTIILFRKNKLNKT